MLSSTGKELVLRWGCRLLLPLLHFAFSFRSLAVRAFFASSCLQLAALLWRASCLTAGLAFSLSTYFRLWTL